MLDDGGQRLRGIAGIADDLEFLVCAEQRPSAERTIRWSSASTIEMVPRAVSDGAGESMDRD